MMSVMTARIRTVTGPTRTTGAAVVLLGGAAAIVAMGLTRHYLPEIVVAIGATLLVAWLLERRTRFVGSGCLLLGLGIALTVADHVDAGRYRDELIFAGVGTALLAVRALRASAFVSAALTLLVVAALEFALSWAPASLSTNLMYASFSDGWAFGVLIAARGAAILVHRLLFESGRGRLRARARESAPQR